MLRTILWSCTLAIVGCGSANDGTNGDTTKGTGHAQTEADAAPPTHNGADGASVDTNGATDGDVTLTCDGVGPIYTMASDPDVGAVDISTYCLEQINGYRAKLGLKPYWLQDTSAKAMCCQAAEAKTAAEIGGHANGGCGWTSQGFCGGGRNPDGNVQASVDWCPRLFFEEGPTGGHYQAMMRVAPRGIMCSFYAVSRDRHSIVVNYY